MVVLLLGACSGSGEDAFCADLRRVEAALEPLRDARERDDSSHVGELTDDLVQLYAEIEPPPGLRDDWAGAIEFFRFLGISARTYQSGGDLPALSDEESAALVAPFSAITDYGEEHCDATRSQLFP